MIDFDVAIVVFDEVSFEEVDAIACGILLELLVVCVGPHDLVEFD